MKDRKAMLSGYMFLMPSMIGFVLFMLFPVLFSLYLSFNEWDLVSGLSNMRFIGLDNFTRMFQDASFGKALVNNIVYTAIVVPVTMFIALLLAIVLNDKVFGRGVLRLIFFIPYITTIVAVAIVWLALYHPSQGPINQLLISLGVDNPPSWMAGTSWALPGIILMMIWGGLGYDLIIYMAGLQGIPKEMLEAAEVDGAGKLRRFFHITIPLLSPTTFFLFVTRIIHSFEVFTPVNIMTQGGPGESTSVLVYYIYVVSFKFYQFGYGSAVAWVLFLIIFAITLLQWSRQKKWVSY